MTPRIKLDPRRIQVWQRKRTYGRTSERITWFDGTTWRCTYVNNDAAMGAEQDWKKSPLTKWLVASGYTELTTRSDA